MPEEWTPVAGRVLRGCGLSFAAPFAVLLAAALAVAAAFVKDAARAKEAGFYRYLTKPVKVPELLAALEELLLAPSPAG